MSFIQLNRINKSYRLGNTHVKALKGIDMAVERGEFLSMAGPSGSGKTTILNLIGILDCPDSGDIHINGMEVTMLPARKRAQFRLKNIGFIFQSFNLLPILTVQENIEYPLILLKHPKKERSQRVEAALEAVGLMDRAAHKPDQLSGGQRQRVAIGRALVTEPQIVLADEPTANLDSKTGNEILDLMANLNENKNMTFIFASHDPNIIKRARRVVVIHDGEIARPLENGG